MVEARPISELLKLMLEHQDFFRSGLCGIVFCLRDNELISFDEHQALLRFIKLNRPHPRSNLEVISWQGTSYYWQIGNKKPRIQWLEYHIAQFSGQPRSLLSLLEIMEQSTHLFEASLCQLTSDMWAVDLITVKESDLLYKYIRENRPSKYSSIAAFKSRKNSFYWPKGEIKYRLSWLRKHIEIQKRLESRKS